MVGSIIGGFVGGIVGGKIYEHIVFSRIAAQGVLIGRAGYEAEAAARRLAHYDGMPGFKSIARISPSEARQLGWANNYRYLSNVMKYGGSIYTLRGTELAGTYSDLSFKDGISWQWNSNLAADAFMWGSISGVISGYSGGYIGDSTKGFSQIWWKQGIYNAGINMAVTTGQSVLNTGTLDPYAITVSGIFGFFGGAIGNTGLFNGKIGENIINPIISGVGLLLQKKWQMYYIMILLLIFKC